MVKHQSLTLIFKFSDLPAIFMGEALSGCKGVLFKPRLFISKDSRSIF